MAHKAELRAKVEKRYAELQQALAAAERNGDAVGRLDSLRVVLRNYDDATQGGWDSVSEVTAMALTKWLETTDALVPQAAADRAAAAGKATDGQGAAGSGDLRWENDAAANIRFALPASWTSRRQGKVLVVSSARPGEHGIGIEFVSITGGVAEGKAAEAEMLAAVAKTVEGAHVTTPAKPVKQHGLTGFVFGGKGTKEGHAIDWFSIALGAGSEKGVLAMGFVRADESSENKKVLLEVLNSIQPLQK